MQINKNSISAVTTKKEKNKFFFSSKRLQVWKVKTEKCAY